MKSAQILRQKIGSGTLTLGAIATFHVWPGLIELLIKAGLDYVIVDLEHLTHNHELVAEMCTLGRLQNFPVLIRPPAAEFTPIRLAMDLGPCGLLVPYVESLSDLAVVQDGVYLKPRGRRRPGGLGTDWVSGLNYANWKSEVEDDLIVLPQIETQVGLTNAAAIAAHPLTTALAIGPYDLSADLGVCWEPGHPALQEAWKTVESAARAAGKPLWAIGDHKELISRGFHFICVGEPTQILGGALARMVKEAKPPFFRP